MNKIAFEKLGISLNVNPVAFSVGGKDIYWYAIIILTGFLLGLAFCMYSAKKRNINPDHVYDIAIYGLIVGVICARIYYVIFDFESFKNNLLDIFKIWEGGIAIYGGIIGAVIAGYVYCRKKKLCVYEMFDICAPGLLIGQAIGRYGNFFNAEVYGNVTNSFLGMSINGGPPVHPLFLYESTWNLLGFIIILLLRDKKKAHGQVFYGYLLWYGAGRLVLEGMRWKEYILYAIDGVVGISQIVSALIIIFSSFMMIKLGKSKTDENREHRI